MAEAQPIVDDRAEVPEIAELGDLLEGVGFQDRPVPESLEHVLEIADGTHRFRGDPIDFRQLWKSFAEAYKVEWIDEVEADHSRWLRISYKFSERSELRELQKNVHRFLQALSSKVQLERTDKVNGEKSTSITIPFVKLICYVANQTGAAGDGPLNSDIVFNRPLAIVDEIDETKPNTHRYRSSCLFCIKMKLVETHDDLAGGARQTYNHWYNIHWNTPGPGQNFVSNDDLNQQLKLRLDDYFVLLQQNIASGRHAQQALDLKSKEYWFEPKQEVGRGDNAATATTMTGQPSE